MSLEDTISEMRSHHRFRRAAMSGQMRCDRSAEAFARSVLGFNTGMEGADREKLSAAALKEVERARKGEDCNEAIAAFVATSDQARLPYDNMRKEREKEMARLAKALPAWAWADGVQGFGAQGFAVIVAETASASAPLSFSSYIKGLDGIYSRLGFANYGLPTDGGQFAGSTWKRPTWRPRALTADEWVSHPFAAIRYSQMFVIADSLLRKQTISKTKTASGKTEPNGPYGEVYCKRLDRTAQTHPEWTPMHSRRDAMRVAMKALIADLYEAWMRLTPIAADGATTESPETASRGAPRSAASEPAQRAA